jgi:hypothetical protein
LQIAHIALVSLNAESPMDFILIRFTIERSGDRPMSDGSRYLAITVRPKPGFSA